MRYPTRMHEILEVADGQSFSYGGLIMSLNKKGDIMYAPYGLESIVRIKLDSTILCEMINNTNKIKRYPQSDYFMVDVSDPGMFTAQVNTMPPTGMDIQYRPSSVTPISSPNPSIFKREHSGFPPAPDIALKIDPSEPTI